MPLSGSTLGGLIRANLAADGAIGSKLTTFSNALGNGIVSALVGSTFTTNDTGSGAGGTGSGTGITSLSSSNMVNGAFNQMTSHGPKATTFLTAIMTAVVSHLSSAATLMSVDPSVGTGTGTIVVGSFSTTISAMQGTIHSALVGDGANGSELSNLSFSLAYGIVTELLAEGTGTLIITGPGGGASSGTGTGTLT